MSVLEKSKASAPPKPEPRKALPINSQYEDKAKTMLRGAMNTAGIDYEELANRLKKIGVEISTGGVANKISRGGFSASFLLQCLDVIGASPDHG